MRFFGWISFLWALVFSAIPALADTTAERFPFAVEAGPHRNAVLYPFAGPALRLVFPAVGVERPSKDRAILHPGEDGRVVFQVIPSGATDYVTGAILHFGQAPLVLRLEGDRLDMAGSLKGLSVPLTADPGADLGMIAFRGMSFSLSLPTRPSPAVVKAAAFISAERMLVDPALITIAMPGKPVLFEAVDFRARATMRMVQSVDDFGALFRSVLRIDLEEAGADVAGGRTVAQGAGVFGEDAAPNIDGTLSLGNFAPFLQNLMSGGNFVPERVLPLVLVAGSIGTMTEAGALNFRVRTTEEGGLAVNDRPAPVILGQ